jgi:hypothetical protein
VDLKTIGITKTTDNGTTSYNLTEGKEDEGESNMDKFSDILKED